MSPTFHESFAAFKTINAIYNLVNLSSLESHESFKIKEIIKKVLFESKFLEEDFFLSSFRARFFLLRLAQGSSEFHRYGHERNEEFIQTCLKLLDEAFLTTRSLKQYNVCILHLRKGDLSAAAKVLEKIESTYYQSLVQGYIVRLWQQERNLPKAIEEAKKIKLESLRRCLLEKIFNQMIH